MHFAVNGKAAFVPHRTGLEEYTYQLIRQWVARPPKKHAMTVYTNRFPDRGAVVGETLEDFFKHSVPANITFKLLKSPYLWSQVRLSVALLADKPHVFFNTEQLLPLHVPARSVVTVHDLGFEYFPETHTQKNLRYLRYVTRRSSRLATALIAVSENTKRDLIQWYGVRPEKIIVIHHGFASPDVSWRKGRTLDHVGQVKLKLPFDRKTPYFLYLGRLELRKNVLGIIRAFELLRLRYKLPHNLVLAGNKGFGYGKIRNSIDGSPVGQFIYEVGHVRGVEKLELLRHAAALVFVSFFEGFGLPVLEAQALGVPVVASNTSSLPEVGGKGSIFVAPSDYEAIADSIFKLVTFPQFRSYYIQQGYVNTRRFSWSRTARQTIQVIEEIGEGRRYF